MISSIVIFALAYASLQSHSVQQYWAHLIDGHGQSCWITVIIPWAIGVAVYWVFGCIMLMIEFCKCPRVIYNRKIQANVTLQPRGSLLQPPLSDCCRTVVANQFAVMLPTLLAIVSNLTSPFCSFSFQSQLQDFFCKRFAGIEVERHLPTPQRMVRFS